ncbi:MAG: hypothetical protein PHC51_13335 [bacterium]|nr:hypothetical protein [bacterium]
MSSSEYAPSLISSESLVIQRKRSLPLPGKVLVKVGDRVNSNTEIAQAMRPGDITVVRLADRMEVEPERIAPVVKLKKGDVIKAGDEIARVSTFFGLFETVCKSPTDGTVEFFTEDNAHFGIRHHATPFSVDSYISGTVVDIISDIGAVVETHGALIQGIFGVGSEANGTVFCLPVTTDKIISASDIDTHKERISGAIIVGGAQITIDALAAAAKYGAAGVVTASIDAGVLHNYIGYPIGVSMTGDEDIPFPLIITEGFGRLSMSERVLTIARRFDGYQAAINGTTQVRAGATRPELIILRGDEPLADTKTTTEHKSFSPGSKVRIVREPYFGETGEIVSLPVTPETIASGAIVRIANVRLDSGHEQAIPRANIELL